MNINNEKRNCENRMIKMEYIYIKIRKIKT